MWVTGGDVAQQVDERFGKQDVVYLRQKKLPTTRPPEPTQILLDALEVKAQAALSTGSTSSFLIPLLLSQVV